MGSFNLGLKQTLLAGGFTLFLLIGLSVYAFALIWERRSYYRRTLGEMPSLVGKLRAALASGNLKEASALCSRHPGAVSAVAMATLVGPTGREERRGAAERAVERQQAALERGLPALGTIGSVAPFIGLFGTVLGVMRAFRDLAGAANAGPGVVAVGISEALVATAAGLFVAIPCIAAYNYFTTRAARFSDEMRWLVDEILEHLTER